MRPAIDIVTEKDLNRPLVRAYLKILVDEREQLGQNIGAPMDVTDRINANSGGKTRPRF
jgi:hypothetical protein